MAWRVKTWLAPALPEGDLSVNGKRVAMTTRIMAEQKEILNRLGVKPIPAQLPTRQVVV